MVRARSFASAAQLTLGAVQLLQLRLVHRLEAVETSVAREIGEGFDAAILQGSLHLAITCRTASQQGKSQRAAREHG